MSKLKLLTIAVIVLVLLNITTLAALFMRGPGQHVPPKVEGPKAIVIERLGFDADQVEAYEGVILEHRDAIASLDEEMMASRNRLYMDLRSSNYPEADSLIVAIGALQQRVEQVHFAHFNSIRALCRPGQIPAFNALVDDLAMYFSHEKQGPGPNKP